MTKATNIDKGCNSDKNQLSAKLFPTNVHICQYIYKLVFMEDLSLKEGQTFTDFKEKFYARFPDVTVFDFGEHNGLKIVLDGLKVNYRSKGEIHFWHTTKKSNGIRGLLSNLKRKATNFQTADIGLFGPYRKIGVDGSKVSMYYDTLSGVLKKRGLQSVMIFKSGAPDRGELSVERLSWLQYAKQSTEERQLKTDVLSLLDRLKLQFSDNDFENVRFAFDVFLKTAFVYRKLFSALQLKQLFVICHYHNEGMIWAAQSLNIRTIELQHGLIAPSDIFYMMPKLVKPVANRMLMPNKMFTFGPYWKALLSRGGEYTSDQIDVLGYYFSQPTQTDLMLRLKKVMEEKQVILFTTQTYLGKEMRNYLSYCYENMDMSKYFFLVKIHPKEVISDYSDYIKLPNVEVTNELHIDNALDLASVHVSIYSTTLYDALRHNNVVNFSYEHPRCADYTQRIISEGVALPLKPKELPNKLVGKKALDGAQFFTQPVLWDKLFV